MKRILAAFILFGSPAFAASTCGVPGQAQVGCVTYTSGASGISATSANSPIVFTDNKGSGSGAQICATTITVVSRSASANTCYLNWDQSVASATLDFPLAPGATVTRVFPVTFCRSGMGIICASAQTATMDVIAQP